MTMQFYVLSRTSPSRSEGTSRCHRHAFNMPNQPSTQNTHPTLQWHSIHPYTNGYRVRNNIAVQAIAKANSRQASPWAGCSVMRGPISSFISSRKAMAYAFFIVYFETPIARRAW